MSLWKNTQHAFVAGQLDTYVMGRQDIDKYARGATTIKNFLVKRQGCISKRRGTDLTADLDNLLGLHYDGTKIVPGKMRLVAVTNGDDGRYVVLSNGVAFVANRDGVLTSARTRVRSIAPYVAEDENGNAVVVSTKDARESEEWPVETIHTRGPGDYSVTRFGTLQEALDAAVDGDTVRLHHNILINGSKECALVRSESFTVSDGTGTVAWDSSSDYFTLTRGGTAYKATQSQRYRNKPTFDVGKTVTATLKWAFSDGGTDWTVSFSGSTWTLTDGATGTAYTENGSSAATEIAFTVGGGTVTATRSYEYSDAEHEFTLARQDGHLYYFASPQYDIPSVTANSIMQETFTLNCRPFATRARKDVTIDLNGYTVSVVGSYGAFLKIYNDCCGVTLTSTRGGAAVSNSPGGSSVCIDLSTSSGKEATGSIAFDGDVTYTHYGQGPFLRAKQSESVTIASGTFISDSEYDFFEFTGSPKVTVNGGDFTVKTQGFKNAMFLLESSTVEMTVNGGRFEMASTDEEDYTVGGNGNGYIFGGISICPLTVAGGRFVCDPARFNRRTAIATHMYAERCSILRGEFSFSALNVTDGDSKEHALTEFGANTVWNDESPNAAGYYCVKQEGEEDYVWTATVAAGSARPMRVAVPYADDDLADLCIRQSGDTLFIAHRSYAPAKIVFSDSGEPSFEEIEFDNTEWSPPNIVSASKDGFEAVETDWPTEFPTKTTAADGTAKWDDSGCPAWLSKLSTATNKTKIDAYTILHEFIEKYSAMGTVTNAGFSGNSANGTDGSCNCACSYTITVESASLETGRKVVTVAVLSFTFTTAFEKTTTYTDGVPSCEKYTQIDTGGSASNDAAASSALVPRTIKYVATYVKDGRESRPSNPVEIDYSMPWPNNAVVNLSFDKGRNSDEPEYYNVYKDNGSGYGLIGTVGSEVALGGIGGTCDTYKLWTPDNANDGALVCTADYESRRGWSVGGVMRKLVASGRDEFTASPASDVCLVCTEAHKDDGVSFDFDHARFNKVKILLDGRIYDRATDTAYLVISTCRVTMTLTYWKTDSTTATWSEEKTYPVKAGGDSISSSLYDGIYDDWLHRQRRAFTAPNGDTVYGWLCGAGAQADDLNGHLRAIVWDFSAVAGATDFNGVKSIKCTFDTLSHSDWTTNQQGCIHAIHFYWNSDTADGGQFQDDYITPDMTVTPPPDAEDPHFSADDEYPGAVGIYQQRLCFASTNNSPSTVWLSRVADLYTFTAHESVREDDALELTLAATEFPKINHLVAGRDLMLFGDGGEWLVAPVSGNTLSYKTASAKLQSMIGSERTLAPLQLADETLFAERGGTCLRTINYNYSSDSYQSLDLSVLSQSIFRANPIVSMAYKQHPDSIVECVLADGRVATLVYMREQEVVAWSVQELGGGWKAREIVTPKCIVNGTTEMMLLVERDGVFQMWRVRDDDDAKTAAAQVVLDGLRTSRSATPDEEGETVVALGGGIYAHGYAVESEFVSVRPEPEAGATAQMEIKNATEAEIRVVDASTFAVRPYGIKDGWREARLEPTLDGDGGVALCEADVKKTLVGANGRDGRLQVRHAAPWPISILSVSTTYQVEYENGGNGGGGK